jgi:hypothetical protein
MQLSTGRTRRDLTLLQCVQNWLHIYRVLVAPSLPLNFLVREVKNNVDVMSGLRMNGENLHVPTYCRGKHRDKCAFAFHFITLCSKRKSKF